ncbi:DUF1835 domain-containing protein [Clostridium sp. MSJ-11]|uniref:DUF1835 domain-containing protein n=1 Tax=Clostridium mobile TaxID=2841512 RepID=A0ABS6EGL1_9CLOT|nr:DUF1835 domain-containing protein [Clostridium mobile]MBU5484343.1 DUF1835 domain-containing protein [Clostridium mobile]
MLHICFDDSAYGGMRHAMKLKLIKEENVVSFNDDLSVGNISNCREYEYRKAVIHNIYSDYGTDIDDGEIKKSFDNFYEILSKENDFIIWYAHNPRDYCNLYYIVSLLKDKNIKVVECIEKTFEDRTLFYKWVNEVCIEDLPILLKKGKILSEEKKFMYTKKWKELVSQNGLLRAEKYEGIETVEEDYYDDLILKRIPTKNIPMIRVVGELIGMDKPCLRDWFVVWRIKQLVTMGCVEIEKRCDRYMLNDIRKVI